VIVFSIQFVTLSLDMLYRTHLFQRHCVHDDHAVIITSYLKQSISKLAVHENIVAGSPRCIQPTTEAVVKVKGN